MEMHPILGRGDVPQPGFWYVISSCGQYPSMRVGHTIMYVAGRDGKSDKLVIVGGANPSGPFAETHILYLDKYEWDELECDGMTGRYEHCAFIPENQPDKIYIFGGADQATNLNDVQMLDLATEKWTSISVTGTPPSPRTCRNSVSIGNKLYVFGGGGEKSEPVPDRKVHVFDAESLSWSQPEVQGKVPKPRLGHVMVALGNKIYLHGGMARDTFYNELHELHTETMTWKPVRCKGDVPSGCTAHAAVAISDTQFCIHGGMTPNGALDMTFVFDTVSSRWKKMTYEGPPPACRLDHAICLGYLTAQTSDNSESKSTGDAKETINADENAEGDALPTRNEDGGTMEKESVNGTEVSDGDVRTSVDLEGDLGGKSESLQCDVSSVEDAENSGSKTKTSDNVQVTISSESAENTTSSSASKEVCDDGHTAHKDTEHVGMDIKDTSKEGGASACDAHNTSAEATEALAGVSTINSSKPSSPPPLTSAEQAAAMNTNIDALSSLLSIEGTKQVLSLGRRSGGDRPISDASTVKTLVCVIHGGMDTEGEIFDDCLVWRVDVPL